jgi:hypothetical protein
LIVDVTQPPNATSSTTHAPLACRVVPHRAPQVSGQDAAAKYGGLSGRSTVTIASTMIVIARGGERAGGTSSPFSDEGMIRAVATCTTPVVRAVGHEDDQPLLDLVADVPRVDTHWAAKRLVPDVSEEIVKVLTCVIVPLRWSAAPRAR